MLTIFTPTFNRSDTIERVYNSLKRQTCKNFEWIIIDDGSTDNTNKIVNSFNQKDFKIHYIYQENKGKHIANNIALDLAKGDLFTCLDSDDWFYDDSVEYIINYFKNNPNTNVLMGLDTYKNGEVIGPYFKDIHKLNWIKMRYSDRNTEDKCYIFRTRIIKDIKFPNYGKSKHMPPSYQLIVLSSIFDFSVTNKKLKFVEYREDGISRGIRKQFFISAENYCEYRKLIHLYLPNNKEKIKNIILFNISWIHTGFKKEYLWRNSVNKFLTILLLPISLFIYLYYKENNL